MRKRRVAWGLFLLAALGLYLFENNSGTRLLLLAALLPPLWGAAWLFLPRRGVRACLTLPETARRGEKLRGTLRMENMGSLPLTSLRVELSLRNRFTGEEKTESVSLSLGGRKSAELPFELKAEHSGALALTVTEALLRDPLGLFARRLPVSARGSVTVPPELFPMEISLADTADFLQDSQRYSSQRPGYDPSEVFRLREYAPGDPVRQIHWKLSEKTGRTMVRDFGLPVVDQILLLLDTAAPEGERVSPAELDGICDLLFSLSAALLDLETPHTVGWADRETGTYATQEVHGPGDLETLTERVLSAPAEGTETAAASCLGQTLRCAYAHVAVAARGNAPENAALCRGNRVTVLLSPERAEEPRGGELVTLCPPEELRRGALKLEL